MLQDGRVHTVDALVAWLSTQHIQSLDLRGSHVTCEKLRHRPSSVPVWRAATVGTTVSNGVITLPEGAVLLLDGTGANFEHITFQGVPVQLPERFESAAVPWVRLLASQPP